MKIFKSIDEKFAEIGFEKVKEGKYGVEYERENNEHGYIQCLCLLHKKSGNHIVQSYDKNLFDEKKIRNTCIGLTMHEMKLCLNKMKKMGWKTIL